MINTSVASAINATKSDLKGEDRLQCPGSHLALPSDRVFSGAKGDNAVCSYCHAKVAVWFANEQWTQRAHLSGIDTDEPELAVMVRTGVRGGAISLGYDPML